MVVVVSDHGFAKVEHSVNLVGQFAEAGLLVQNPTTHKVTSWDAAPWGGASVAVVLRDPNDAAVKAKTKALLDKLAADPEFGIDRVIGVEEIARMGGTPMAAYWIDFKLGYSMGGECDAHLALGTARHPWLVPHPPGNARQLLHGRTGCAQDRRPRRNRPARHRSHSGQGPARAAAERGRKATVLGALNPLYRERDALTHAHAERR